MNVEAVTTALNLLGTSPEAIAATLANKGIKGVRGKLDACPLARYLALQFPGQPLYVTQYAVEGEDQETESAKLPFAAQTFVLLFDATDNWPELEESA